MDRFHLLHPIASGGMAVVWLAERVERTRLQPGESVYVAIKRVHPTLIDDVQVNRMFELEAELHGRFRHKNVVAMIEHGRDPPSIAMELVRGLDLATFLSRARVRRRAIPIDLCAFIARELSRGLSHVHGWGVLHCDVSPRNVLLSLDGEVKLTDFGCARYVRDPSCRENHDRAFMKAGYVAPERLHGEGWSRGTDLWALGVVLHELLTGERLFRASTFADTLCLVERAPIEKPSLYNSAVPDALDQIALALLERDRDVRTPSAQCAGEELAPFLPSSGAERRLARLVAELSTIPEDADDAQPTERLERLAAA